MREETRAGIEDEDVLTRFSSVAIHPSLEAAGGTEMSVTRLRQEFAREGTTTPFSATSFRDWPCHQITHDLLCPQMAIL